MQPKEKCSNYFSIHACWNKLKQSWPQQSGEKNRFKNRMKGVETLIIDAI